MEPVRDGNCLAPQFTLNLTQPDTTESRIDSPNLAVQLAGVVLVFLLLHRLHLGIGGLGPPITETLVVSQFPTLVTFQPPSRTGSLPFSIIRPGAMACTTAEDTGVTFLPVSLLLRYIVDNSLVAEQHLTLLAPFFTLHKCNCVFQGLFISCKHVLEDVWICQACDDLHPDHFISVVDVHVVGVAHLLVSPHHGRDLEVA